mmetsp:Transcript_19185/g.40206  ORF Transcript_19185/g.40206 Transcript_19185/m.40206 type:complete len:349 (-) Transcript_19185:62-1108(-)
MAGELISDYERQRADHIRRNKEYMERLGCTTTSSGLFQSPVQRQSNSPARAKGDRGRKRETSESTDLPRRRSSRLLGKDVEYTSEDLDAVELFEEAEGLKRRRRSGAGSDGGEGAEEAEKRLEERRKRRQEEVLEITRRWLDESRAALLAVRVDDSGSGSKWKAEAERRWGDNVSAALSSQGSGRSEKHSLCWKTYVTSRLSQPPPPSPYSLLQEFYAHDTWRLLVCCVLMSRVSSWETKHACISAFFERFPTPTDLQRAEDLDKKVLEVIQPLGLFENRIKALMAVTTAFLCSARFAVDLKENKIYGIGQFGVDSYNIFCKGLTKCKPQDKTLASYCNWHIRTTMKT